MLFHRGTSVSVALFMAFVLTTTKAMDPNCVGLEDGVVCQVGQSGNECTCDNQVCNNAGCGGNGNDYCGSDQQCDDGYFCNKEIPGQGVCQKKCSDGQDVCGDPHMQGLRGQTIDWSGVDGGWYSLVADAAADLHVNLRTTAPLPEEFPDRQLVTGVSVLSAGHSFVIEVKNPYSVDTGSGCPAGVSPCLANGGLRAVVDGQEQNGILRSLRQEDVAEGITVSASNLPVECRQFGGGRTWARIYDDMLQSERELFVASSGRTQSLFEDWVLRFESMAAPEWCARYVDQHDLADVQSVHAVFRITTADATVRLNVGTNYQGDGELAADGRVLPDMEFWQMNVGMDGLSLEHQSLSGLLGETARPVVDESGHEVMHGYEAFRGTVEDYRVDGPLGTDFALLHQ